MNQELRPLSRTIFLITVLLPLSAQFVPLWQILMWAPQYPEGLEMKIWMNDISGDIKIINALNHYIGMRTIEKEMFPEFTYMPFIIYGIIFSGVIFWLRNRLWGLLVYLGMLALAGLAALFDFYLWGYDYGHNLNPNAPIKVPGLSYQPPVLGTKQLLNFTAFSGPDLGGWCFIIAGLLVATLIIFEIRKQGKPLAN